MTTTARTCPKCGAESSDGSDRHCTKCGMNLADLESQNTTAPRSESSDGGSASSTSKMSWFWNIIAHDPDESQRLLPWPSWSMQRLGMWTGILVGGFLTLSNLGAIGSITGMLWLGAFLAWFGGSLYIGITTRWLRECDSATKITRIIGGVTMALSALALIGMILVAAFWIVVAVLVILAAIAMIWLITRGPSGPSRQMSHDEYAQAKTNEAWWRGEKL